MTQTTPTRDEAVARARQTARRLTERAIELSAGGRIPNDDAERMRIGGARLRELADLIEAPAPASGRVDAVKPTVEQIARAICRGRDLNPDCQNQGAARDGTVDGNWPEPRENFGRPYDTRWHYGWRNQAKAAESVLDLLASLSPAATPVSEAEPVAWRVRERAGFPWELLSGDPTRHPKYRGDEIQPLYLAKPASSPAGGDREATYRAAWEHADSDLGWDLANQNASPNSLLAEQIARCKAMVDAALSQSTSAGRVE